MKYRAAQVAAAPGKAGPIRFVAATEGKKADGLNLVMSGARLDRWKANPVVMWAHRYLDLPIGRGAGIEVAGRQLLIDVEFDGGDPFAAQVERKVRAGILSAASVGFEPDPSQTDEDGTVRSWELLEMSVVPVPMDPEALVGSGREALEQMETAFRELSERFGERVPATLEGAYIRAIGNLRDEVAVREALRTFARRKIDRAHAEAIRERRELEERSRLFSPFAIPLLPIDSDGRPVWDENVSKWDRW